MSEEQLKREASDILWEALGDDVRLREASRAIREVEAQDATRGAAATRAAFAPIHARLMDRIAEDTAGTFVESVPQTVSRRWPWNAPVSASRRAFNPWQRARMGFVMASLLVAATFSAHEVGRQRSSHELPLQQFVDDFDTGIKSPSPFEFTAFDTSGDAAGATRAAKQAAGWLSARAGIPIAVPPARAPGLTLIGARHSILGERSVAQAHYLQSGVRVALYQVRDSGVGLGSMDQVKIGQRTFLTSSRGQYRIVAWRSGEDVLTLVSPLAMRESLLLAQHLRSNHVEPKTAS